MADHKKSAHEPMKSGQEKFGEVVSVIFAVLKKIFRYIADFKKIWLALPVGAAAIYLAVYANEHFPEYVGINLLETGDYAYLVTREIAVMGPLAITALCLLLMFCSKRTLFPWLVSVFSLVLTPLILVTNLFMA